jgi:methionyl-tRNA formyltransferase
MKTVVFAYHNIGIAGLEALKRKRFEIEAVFTHRDDPGEDCWFDSVYAWAQSKGIPVFRPWKINAERWIRKIRDLRPDVLFSFHYRYMLCNDILKIPARGAYNLHASLLPAYRGRSPVNWVLVHGETKTGVTLHHMISRPDAGDIVGQKEVEITPEETALSLYSKLTVKTSELLDDLLPLIRSGNAPRVMQNMSAGSYFGGRKPEDGKIDWVWPAQRIFNLIRAVTRPYPGAFTFLPSGEKMFIWWALPERADSGGACGIIVVEDDRVYVRAGEGKIRLLDIETGGRRLRDAAIADYFETRKGLMLK